MLLSPPTAADRPYPAAAAEEARVVFLLEAPTALAVRSSGPDQDASWLLPLLPTLELPTFELPADTPTSSAGSDSTFQPSWQQQVPTLQLPVQGSWADSLPELELPTHKSFAGSVTAGMDGGQGSGGDDDACCRGWTASELPAAAAWAAPDSCDEEGPAKAASARAPDGLKSNQQLGTTGSALSRGGPDSRRVAVRPPGVDREALLMLLAEAYGQLMGRQGQQGSPQEELERWLQQLRELVQSGDSATVLVLYNALKAQHGWVRMRDVFSALVHLRERTQ